MPSYEYRCNHCGRQLMFSYRTYKEYDAAERTCPHCGSADLTRLISRVSIAKPTQKYSNMSSNQMLSVLEGGDTREIGTLFQQVGAAVPSSDGEYHEVTNRLLQGEKPDSIESDLRAKSEQQISQDHKTQAADKTS
jgi:putative FmdB family regulatory protein